MLHKDTVYTYFVLCERSLCGLVLRAVVIDRWADSNLLKYCTKRNYT